MCHILCADSHGHGGGTHQRCLMMRLRILVAAAPLSAAFAERNTFRLNTRSCGGMHAPLCGGNGSKALAPDYRRALEHASSPTQQCIQITYLDCALLSLAHMRGYLTQCIIILLMPRGPILSLPYNISTSRAPAAV